MERFWSKVKKTDGCWLWTGHLYESGYGQFRCRSIRQSPLRAHRVAYELTYGPIPDGLNVLHSCDVRNCVRPNHLFLGTIQDNSDDMISKGRNAKGSMIGASKLTDDQVVSILTEYASGKTTQQKLADKHHVSQVAISCVVRKKTWAHTGTGALVF